ncbi:MAG: ribonuclease PH, partial [Planctomycetota bacterium]
MTVRRDVPSVAPAVLWEQGETAILATATIEKVVPPWFPEDKPGGWVTANYLMLPGSTPGRKRWPRTGHTDSRGTEIERLIGRSLRAAVDLDKIGPHTITIDCQVTRADGGTRTASICAGYLALADALKAVGTDTALRGQLAAVSVGVVDGEPVLDLDYPLDSRADVDMNIVRNSAGQYV